MVGYDPIRKIIATTVLLLASVMLSGCGTCVGLIAGFAKGHLSTIALPLPLGLIGMLAVYLLSADTWKSYQSIAPQAALALGVAVSVGFFYSASAKPVFELIDLDMKITQYEREKLDIDGRLEYWKKAIEGKTNPVAEQELDKANKSRRPWSSRRCFAQEMRDLS